MSLRKLLLALLLCIPFMRAQAADVESAVRAVLSYSHGPASYTPPAAHLHLTPTALAAFAGHYRGEHAPDIVVGTEANGLVLTASPMTVHLHAASPTRFFALERDLQFDFAPAQNGRSPSLGVYENGKQVATATRVGQ